MSLPLTSDVDRYGNDILKFRPDSVSDLKTDDIPRIPIPSKEVLHDNEIHFLDKNSYFSKGTIVGIKYEVRDELEYKSAYIIQSTYKSASGLWSIKLLPTHGSGTILRGEQAYFNERNKLILKRTFDKVRGGGKMVLAPVKARHLIDEFGDIPQIVSLTI